MKYCVVDAGNTQIKIVDFIDDTIVDVQKIKNEDVLEIERVLTQKQADSCILSSVLSPRGLNRIVELLKPNVVLSFETPLPISIKEYQTPKTLGTDRIANVVAANHYAPNTPSLVIDVGTCITYDLLVDKRYLGGSIAPGYTMRLKAMHEFTGSLPMLSWEKSNAIVGKTTKESMLSGVNYGISSEILGVIATYKEKYPNLTIFLTGGDYKKFEIELKNGIFANDNLTVQGLYLILKHNV